MQQITRIAVLMVALPFLTHASPAFGMKADRSPAPDEANPAPMALPFEIAYGMADLRTDLITSPDGRLVAYVVRRFPPDYDPLAGYDYFLEDGTPKNYVGSRVHLVSIEGGASEPLCEQGGDTWAPSWSPSGRELALYSNAGGSVRLWLHDIESGDCRLVSDVAIKARTWQGDEAVWTPDGKYVYVPLKPSGQRSPHSGHKEAAPLAVDLARTPSVYTFRSSEDQPRKSSSEDSDSTGTHMEHFRWINNAHLAKVDVRAGVSEVIVPADANPMPSVLRRSASGRWLSYLSVFHEPTPASPRVHDLVVLRADGSNRTVVVKDQVVARVGLDFYRLSYRWHPTKDRLLYIHDDALWQVDFTADKAGSPRRIGRDLGPIADRPFAFTRDGKFVLVGTRVDKRATFASAQGLAAVPIGGGSAIHLPIDASRWSLTRLIQADDRFAWQPEPSTVTVQVSERQGGKSAILRIDLQSGQSRILWIGDLATLSSFSASSDHSLLLARYEDFNTPPNVYAFDANFADRRQLSRIDPLLNSVNAGVLHEFESTVPQFDGTLKTVRTGVVMPAGSRQGDRVPAIVMFYPGEESIRAAAQFGGGAGASVAMFTSRGFAVILPHVLTGPLGEPGDAISEITDSLLPQVYRAADLGYVDISRLALMGGSFGGYATAGVLTQSKLFRAAISMVGAYDLVGVFGEFASIDESSVPAMTWIEKGQPRIGNHPWADLQRAVSNSPYYQAYKIHTPILIVDGAEDGPLTESQKMYSALRRLGRTVELSIYEGSGHSFHAWPRANAIDVTKRMLDFLRRHLGDSASIDASARAN